MKSNTQHVLHVQWYISLISLSRTHVHRPAHSYRLPSPEYRIIHANLNSWKLDSGQWQSAGIPISLSVLIHDSDAVEGPKFATHPLAKSYMCHCHCKFARCKVLVSDIAVFVLKRDVKLQQTNQCKVQLILFAWCHQTFEYTKWV